MNIEDARCYLVDLKKLGGDTPTISGGEPFLYEELVVDILKLVQEVYGYSDVWILTNAFWCKDDNTVREKYESLRKFCGAVMSSVDFFHFEWTPIGFARRSLNTAADVFGLHNNPHFTSDLKDYSSMLTVSCREAVEFEGTRLTGNAAFALAPFVPGKPVQAFSSIRCAGMLLEYDSIHIDPYGNVFPACYCKGIVLGNAKEYDGGLHALIKKSKSGELVNEVIDILASSGPVGLLQEAVKLGYQPLLRGYASACHLCYMVRHFLYTHGYFRDSLGPWEIYYPTADEKLGPEILMKL
jgi:hypothetical protein